MNATEGGSWRVGIFFEGASCFGGTALGKPSKLVLNADEMPGLRLEESERTGIPTVIHVGTSAVVLREKSNAAIG